MYPKYRGKLFEDEDLKMAENRRLGPQERQNAPRAFLMRPVHAKSRKASVFFYFRFG